MNPAVAFGSFIGAWSPPNPGMKNKLESWVDSAIELESEGFSKSPNCWAHKITELVSWNAPSKYLKNSF